MPPPDSKDVKQIFSA